MTPIKHLRLYGKKLLAAAIITLLAPVAEAGPYKVYGPEFAWVNNFNNSTINSSFSTNSVPGMTVWYNFSGYSLYGYPAIVRGWHYGWNPAGDTLFPKQISATKSIPCSFAYSSGGTNMAGDFAYDMFLRWDNQKSPPSETWSLFLEAGQYPKR
jgi:hypothetical protein